MIKMIKYCLCQFVLIVSLLAMPIVAQTRQQLEAQKKKTLESLAKTNKLILLSLNSFAF